jgi:hypothetical protein
MSIEKDIEALAKLAHDTWALERLIHHIGSMSEEDLEKALPRILKLRPGLENRATSAEPATHAAALLFDDGESLLRGRFRYGVSKLRGRGAALISRLTRRRQFRTSALKRALS